MKSSLNASSHEGEPQSTQDHGKSEIIVEAGDSAKLKHYRIGLLIALAGITFFYGLGELALTGPDEPRYAEVGREMFISGDFISPRLAGCLWFEKPALFYWLAAAGYALFGVSEFAARAGSASCATLTALTLYLVLRRHASERLGALTSVVLITSGIFIGYARAATPDMALSASITLALLAAYVATSGGRARIICWPLCGAATGAAVLAKGLVGVVLVVAILFLYLLVSGRLRDLRWRDLAAASLSFVVVASLWYLPITTRHGWEFIDDFIIDHHFRRYVSNRFYHPQPFYFYPVVALAGVLPWTCFFFPAVARIQSLRPRRGGKDSLLALAWIWVLVPVFFFSFSGSKLPGYILPVFPAMAIIIGNEVERVWKGEFTRGLKLALWLSGSLLLAVGGGFAIYLNRLSVGAGGWRILPFILPAAAALFASAMLVVKRRRAFLAGGVAVVLSIVVGAVTLLFPRVNDLWSLKRLSLEVASALRPGEKIGFFIYKEYAPVYYAEGRVACGHGEGDVLNALNEDKLVDALEREGGLILITLQQWQNSLEREERINKEFLGSQGKVLAYRVWLKEEGR